MKILLADDEKTIRVTLADALEEEGHQVRAVSTGIEAWEEFTRGACDCLVADVRMPGLDGITLLARIKEERPAFPVIIITAQDQVEPAVEAMRLGAETYIKKPFDNEEIVVHMRKVEEHLAVRGELLELRARLLEPEEDFDEMIGASPAMHNIFSRIDTVAGSEFTVLIAGENGTGKELIARSLHLRSPRREECFLVVNCAALAENLVESELFGHVRGSFTGADRDRPGKFEAAGGGTLFLDEVGEMPLPVQVKLLRVLESGQVTPVGSNEPRATDVRLIAATNRDLVEEVEAGRFREDLFYRLNVITIDVPPLRERPEDIPLLVRHFARRFGGDREYELPEDALMALLSHSWPGNVRELQNAIKRAIALSGREAALKKEHLFHRAATRRRHTTGAALDLRPLKEVTAEAEMRHIRGVLRYTSEKKGKAAEILGISRKRLWEKLKEFRLET